jgi:CRP-like cAMP-binding protein
LDSPDHTDPRVPLDKSAAIARVSAMGWLARQSPELRQALLQPARLRRFQAGAVIYRAGAAPAGMFGLVEGRWALKVPPSQALISVQDAGRWAGDAAAMRRRPAMITIQAMTPCRVLHLSQADFDLLVRDPEHCRAIAALTAEGLGEAVTVVANLVQPGSALRVAQRLLTFVGLYGDVRLALGGLSQADLAIMCGLSRQTLNKELRSLQAAGVVSITYRTIEILDLGALQAIAHRPPD